MMTGRPPTVGRPRNSRIASQPNQAAPIPKTTSQPPIQNTRSRGTSMPAIATPISTWMASTR